MVGVNKNGKWMLELCLKSEMVKFNTFFFKYKDVHKKTCEREPNTAKNKGIC